MKHILIVKTSALGDIVHTYPVVNYLKNKFPDVKIDWVVEKSCASLVETHPLVDTALRIATKEWRRAPFASTSWRAINAFRQKLRQQTYDVVFDLQGNIKSGLVVSQARSCHKVGFAKKSVAEWPNMLFTNRRFNPPAGQGIRHDYLALVKAFFEDASTETEFESAHQLLQLEIGASQKTLLKELCQQPALQNKPLVVVCAGSAWKNKQLKPETLIHFLNLIKKDLNCAFLFLWGTPDEHALANHMQQQFLKDTVVADKMPLPVVQNLMQEAQLVIAMDSLPLHLASTTSTPTYSAFGPSAAAKYKPPGIHHAAFQGVCPYGRTFEKRCPILRTCATGACLRDAAAETLHHHFSEWWEKKAKGEK